MSAPGALADDRRASVRMDPRLRVLFHEPVRVDERDLIASELDQALALELVEVPRDDLADRGDRVRPAWPKVPPTGRDR